MALLVFDIGGTAVKYALYKDKELESTRSFTTPLSWKEMKALLSEVKQSFKGETLEGVAISSPGAVDVEAGVIRGISAISYIHDFKIVEELEDLFQLPVTIENDANCAALVELAYGVAKSANTVLFFVIGSGIGGAVAIDGKLHKGINLFGGEFGYMMLDKGYTLSQSASPVHVANRYSSEKDLPTSISGQELFQLSDDGDESARQAVDSLFQALGKGIFNAALVLNPDLVVLGGGLSKRPGLVEEVSKQIDHLREKTGAQDLTISLDTCQFYNDANLLGVVAHFQNNIGIEK
ncbi:ROK family protein [Streptococcus sp.]|nr:ROK family protein [Streptococcus sp.]MDY3824373.1 ROK family protein [Streptococcus sp.]